jgi:glycosyltransferase involved in cell wall biosynthesis
VTNPKISVLMPVYNGEKFVQQAVDSILSQTFDDLEFIIVDDGSTDGSLKIVQSYDDPRIKIVRNDCNIGVARSLNKGLELVKGEYVARMDSDDVSLPRRLEKQVDFLDKNPSYGGISCVTVSIGGEGEKRVDWPADYQTLTFSDIKRRLPKENCIAHPSVMIRTDLLRMHKYNEKIICCEDYDLWLRIISESGKIGKLNEALLKLRRHDRSISDMSGPYRILVNTSRCKFAFFFNKILNGKLNRWDWMVLFYAFGDIFNCGWKALKKTKENLVNILLK